VYPHGAGKVAVPTKPVMVTEIPATVPTPVGVRHVTAVTVVQATERQLDPPTTALALTSLKPKFMPLRVKDCPADEGAFGRETAETTGTSNVKRLAPVATCTPRTAYAFCEPMPFWGRATRDVAEAHEVVNAVVLPILTVDDRSGVLPKFKPVMVT